MYAPMITNVSKEIYRSYINAGRKRLAEDSIILSTITRLYDTTEIGLEEAKFMWVNYLEKGNLYISEAMEMAKLLMERSKKLSDH